MRKRTANRYIVGLHNDGVYIKSSVGSKRQSKLEVRRIEPYGDTMVRYSSRGGTEIVDQRGNLAEPEKYLKEFKQIIKYYDRRFNKPTSRNNKI